MNPTSNQVFFQQVEPSYQHYPKKVHPADALQTLEACLKWYLIYPEHLPISEEEREEAQRFVQEELSTGQLEMKNEVGFVVQHRTPEWMILYVCSWRGNNEIWETLYHKRLSAGGYEMHRRKDTTGTFCVWVMAAVRHEQKAWSCYLRSGRDEAAQEAYLNDQLNDVVW